MNGTLKNYWSQQQLVGKFVSMVLPAPLVVLPIIYGAMQLLVTPAFTTIEKREVTDQTRRAQNSLTMFQDVLANNVSDYAVWDDAYRYARQRDPAFEASTLTPMSYQNMGIDFVSFMSADGKPRWLQVVHPKEMRFLPGENRYFLEHFERNGFHARAMAQDKVTDYVRTPRGLYLIKSQHVVRSDGSGPDMGYLVMGVLLDADTVSEALQLRTSLEDNLSPREIAKLGAARDNSIVVKRDNDFAVRIGLLDGRDQVAGALNFSVPRDTSAAGEIAVRYATGSMLLFILILVPIISAAIRQIAIGRLKQLGDQVRLMREGEFEMAPELLAGNDEISDLARQFANLDADLDTAQRELQNASYVQGKADSAAGMLHNVRNALAPLRIMQERWLATEYEGFRRNMELAVSQLDSPACPADRRKALEAFLLSAAREIANAAPARRNELADAKATVDQIAAILTSYDYDTSANRAGDSIDPARLFNQELRGLKARIDSEIKVVIPPTMPAVQCNRIQLAQVIGNLMANSAEAMKAARVAEPMLTIHWEEEADGFIALHMTDNGDGIAAEDLERIFQRGYSTRTDKAGGLGMHWSAIAMRAMHGSLTMVSAGKGQGATAVLRLKAAVAEPEVSPTATPTKLAA